MKIRSQLLTKLAAWIGVSCLRMLFWTLKKEFRIAGDDQELLAYNRDVQGRYLYCTWHDSIVMPLFMGKPYHMAALVSQHQDGSYLAETMKLLGVESVRGSSKKGAVKALRESLTAADDHHITITPDGPRGPRRQMKDGIIFLASKSGRPIVPMSFECENCWHIKGRWTDLVIPKPFSTVTMILEAPISVPPDASRDEIIQCTQTVQQVMDEVYDRAEHRKAA